MAARLRLVVVCLLAAAGRRARGGLATMQVVTPLAAAGLEADDECSVEACALSELQVSARATAVAAGTRADAAVRAAEARDASGRRRLSPHWAQMDFGDTATAAEPAGPNRRRRLVLWRPTPVVDSDITPATCGNDTLLRKGYEGCCNGQVYEFADTGCCGSVLYRTSELSCCRHENATATVFNPYTTNCCDDPRKRNEHAGEICWLTPTQPACCHLATTHQRRRRRQSVQGHAVRDMMPNTSDPDKELEAQEQAATGEPEEPVTPRSEPK